MLASKSAACDKLAEDLSNQHQKASELRRQVSTLEQNLQVANSAAASTRFKESSLEQELDLAKRNNEWFESELKAKSEEAKKLRQDKGARVAELQRQNEQYISEADVLRRSEASLRSRLDDQIQKFEDLLNEIQQLKEERIRDEENFRADLESSGRLFELQKESADTAKERAQELSIALEEARDEAADEIGRIRAEVNFEHDEKVAAEARIAELEGTVARLESEAENTRAQSGTPQANAHGFSTPMRPGTPSGVFSPASASRIRGGLSMTQMYADYKRMEQDLSNERRTNEQLTSSLEDMVRALEGSRPEIDELRSDHTKLQGELVEMSGLMDAANRERESAVKEVRRLQGQMSGISQENGALQQQVRDSGSQIKVLLMEQHLRENGHEMTQEQMSELRQTAKLDAQALANMNDSGKVISESLVTFTSLTELQEKNANILRMLRQLGDTLESKEAQEKNQLHQQEHEEVQDLRSQVATYKEELQSMVTNQKSYIKERDMFRSMLTRRGLVPGVDSNDFSRSMPAHAGSPPRGFGASASGEDSDYAKLLRDVQQHFDSFRQEAATDHSSLKTQINELSSRNSQLQTEASRAVSQLSASNQRSDMLKSNYDMLKAENTEIQKRSYSAMENATRQELKLQQTAEELVEIRGMLDSARRESANLKAEKDLSRSVQSRLVEDNESLRNERGRLDQLNATLQNMLNEREQSDSETRRRLQSHADSLEAELTATKRKLNDEVEDTKKASLRREYEHEQSQKRIDDLVTTLGSTREELSATKTTRDHLQARVDEMTVELRSAEERLEVFQSRPEQEQTNGDRMEESLITREQELAVEVSELKRDLELKTTELDRTNEQIETYKNISQASEERLQELTETNDQYREETERALKEKESMIKNLEQRIEDTTSELTTTNNELSKLRDEQSESGRRLDEQRTTLEAEIARIKDDAERNAENADYNLQASQAQATIAQEAQQNYETELVRHGEATKTLQAVRNELNQLKLETADLRTQATTAKTDLDQKEESWSEQRDRYQTELADLRKRREEVSQQNNLLHQQLEGLTTQMSALQRDRAQTAEATERNESPAPSDNDRMLEVTKYLRREKEIVDVQYHLSTQEGKRLRQQLEFTQSQLDETRLKLDQQRRLDADSERNAMNHNKLMETLNELNLFRESSVTLRAETKQATAALAEKNARVEELQTQIEPLQMRLSELENLSELREGEMKLLQDDRDHWQQRTQNILSKYDRVDPAELESLKEQLSTLQTERDEAVSATGELQAQIDSIPDQLEAAKADIRSRLGEQFKARSKQLTGRITEKQTELDTATSEKTNLQTELDATKLQLESMKAQAAQSPAEVNGIQKADSAPAKSILTNGQPSTEVSAELEAKIVELEAKVVGLEAAVTEGDQEISALKTEAEEKFKAKETELKGVLNKRLSVVKSEMQTAHAEEIQKLKTEHQEALDAIKATRPPPEGDAAKEPGEPTSVRATQADPGPQPTGDELVQLSDEQVRALIKSSELVKNILKKNIQTAVQKKELSIREELMAAAASSGDAPSAGQIEALEKKYAAEKEAMTTELHTSFTAEKETLLKQYAETVANERQVVSSEYEETLANERVAWSKQEEKKIADQVNMAEKKTAVKLNLLQNTARNAQAKVDIVKQAAETTPQKPVVEVWELAKNAKPPAQPKPAGTAPQAQATAQIQTPRKPSNASNAQEQSPATTTPSAPPPGEAEPAATASEENAVPARPASQAGSQTQTSAIPKPAQTNSGTGVGALNAIRGASNQQRSSIRGGRGGAPGGHQQRNTSEGQHQQPNQRGSGIPRGGTRGRGQGRGGAQNAPVSNPPQTAPANTGSSTLNAAAGQFIPGGNKRAREDGEVSDSGSAGKKIKGGASAT